MIGRWAPIGWLLAVGPLAAQAPTVVAGAVLRPTTTTPEPVAAVRVVLHTVGRATQGPIDSVASDRDGRFRFHYPADTTASFLLSARYSGIEYFSQPLAANPNRPDTAIELLVYDTATTAPIAVESRTLVVGAPDAIGARTVIDWLVLDNRGRLTRVARDSTSASWGAALPPEARNAQLGDPRVSQISPDAIRFDRDSLFVLAPLSPGKKQLLLQYELGPKTRGLDLAFGIVDSAEVFVEERGVEITSPGWVARDSQLFEGRPFRRLQRTDREAATLALRFPRAPIGNEALPYLVALTGLGLVAVTWGLLRRRPAGSAGPSTIALADRIAWLDQAAERDGLEPLARERNREERAALLGQLRAALARRTARS